MKTPGRMLSRILCSSVKKPATQMYPFVKIEKPANFRGKLVFYAEKCIGCKLCMRDCPSNAITIIKTGDKQFECEINLDKCIYCAQCVDSCAKKALEATKEFELAVLDPSLLKIKYSKTNEPEKKS